MRLLLYYTLILMGIMLVLEILMTFHKRTILIAKLRKASKIGGYKIKFKRFPYLSVLFFKGRLDLLIESDIKKYAVVIITSRHRKGKFVFYENKLEIWRKKKYSLVARGRAGILLAGRNLTFEGDLKLKGKIDLHLSKIVKEHPLYDGICLINPVPRQVCISYGTTHTDIHDGDRIHSGFKVYGLSGFTRLLSPSDK